MSTSRNDKVSRAAEAMTAGDVADECHAAEGQREITDACARAIVRRHAAALTPAVSAFTQRGEWPADDPGYPDDRGALDGGTKLYREVFPNYNRLRSGDERLAASMLGTYLLDCRPDLYAEVPAGTVPGDIVWTAPSHLQAAGAETAFSRGIPQGRDGVDYTAGQGDPYKRVTSVKSTRYYARRGSTAQRASATGTRRGARA